MHACYEKSEKLKVVGGGANCTTNMTLSLCHATYENVTQFNPDGLPLVLFTDGRRPELDETFPIIDNHDFLTQFWMMVLSDIHVGNPASTVDRIVMHWRYAQGRQNIEPSRCFLKYRTSYLNEADN